MYINIIIFLNKLNLYINIKYNMSEQQTKKKKQTRGAGPLYDMQLRPGPVFVESKM